jgi:protein involved in plasmid replication-relaxation
MTTIAAPKVIPVGRQAPTKPLMLTQRHLDILQAAWKYRYLTAHDALHLLGFSDTSLTHVRELLAALSGEDYTEGTLLFRFPLANTRIGATEKVYSLGRKGRDVLAEAGFPCHWSFRPYRYRFISNAYVQHALLLSRLAISGLVFSRTHPGFRLVESRLSYDLSREPAIVDIDTVDAQGKPLRRTRTVIPDALVVFQSPDGKRHPLLFEADRNTEGQSAFREHLLSRLVLVQTGTYRQWCPVEAIRIVYCTSGETSQYRDTRRTTMARWALELLKERRMEEWAKVFHFTSVVREELYQPPCRLFEQPVFYQPGNATPVSLFTASPVG